MKQYRDLFGKKLSKQDVVQAVIYTVRNHAPYPQRLARLMGIGYFKANRLAQLLADANVTTPMGSANRKVLLSEDAAVNAALRQLKKGKK